MQNSRLFILESRLSKDGLSNQMRMQKAGNSALLTLRREKFSKCEISLAKEKINKQTAGYKSEWCRHSCEFALQKLARSIWTRKYLVGNYSAKQNFKVASPYLLTFTAHIMVFDQESDTKIYTFLVS
jgi:hypothetical protein